jgi:hypothetical protein
MLEEEKVKKSEESRATLRERLLSTISSISLGLSSFFTSLPMLITSLMSP